MFFRALCWDAAIILSLDVLARGGGAPRNYHSPLSHEGSDPRTKPEYKEDAYKSFAEKLELGPQSEFARSPLYPRLPGMLM